MSWSNPETAAWSRAVAALRRKLFREWDGKESSRMIVNGHNDASAVRRPGEHVMRKSSGDSLGLAAAGAIERARLIRERKLDLTRLKSLNQELRAACDQLQNSLHLYSNL